MNKSLLLSAFSAVTCGLLAQTNLLDDLAGDALGDIATPVEEVVSAEPEEAAEPTGPTNAVPAEIDIEEPEADVTADTEIDIEETETEDAGEEKQSGQGTAATSVSDPASAAATPATAEANAKIHEQGTDEIDLEEIDDTAEANAKRPTIKTNSENVEFVDISCDEATLADILRQFRKTTHANIISVDSTNLLKRVSAEMHHVPWLDALQSLLNTQGFRLEKRGEIYFVDETKLVDPTFTRSFQLNHASADEMATLFNESYGPKDKTGKSIGKIASSFPEANVVVVTANEKTIRDCEGIIKAIDRAVAQIYIEARFLELSANASHALGLNWDSLKQWGVSLKNFKAGLGHAQGSAANYGTKLSSSSTSSNDSLTDSDSKSSSASVDAGGGSTTSASASPSKSTTQSSSLSQTFTGLVPTTIGSAANEAISAADMAWRNAFAYSGQLSADEFHLALSAFESLGEGKVFSNPKSIVANGKEAKVDMTVKEPNVTVEASYTGTSSQNMNISTKLEVIPGSDKLMFAGEAFFSYGITLSVKPRISPDGLINVEIVPTISEWKEDKAVKGASDQAVYTTYPKIAVKRLTTNFTMKDGATAVIGGLTQTVEKDVDDGIPYLRRIPWIGPRLFGRISRQKEQSEIIVFVTVGIANPQELPKDIGLPTNAVIGREYVDGARLEPGFRAGTADEVFAVDTRPLDEIRQDPVRNRNDGAEEKNETRGTVVITPSATREE